jgi:hypothetical protein
MKCTACAKDLPRKEAMYTKEREPYCSNPFNCNDLHPNSVKNIIARGGAVTLYTEDQIELDMLQKLNLSPEMKARITTVATKPQSIRLNRQDLAYYVLQLQENHNMSSISEAVRYCVNYTMDHQPIETVPKPTIDPNVPLDEPESIVEVTKGVHGALTGEPIRIPDMPKSINVDWSKVELPVKPEPKEEEEEIMEF